LRIPDSVFPEPYTVPNNTDEQSYVVKVRFIKKCLTGHLISVFAATACAVYLRIPLTDPQLILILAGILIALTIIRFSLRSGKIEQIFSTGFLLAALPIIGQLGRDIQELGFPIIAFPITAVLIGIYALGVGRDFSFPGMVGVCSIALAPILWILRAQGIEMLEMVAVGWFLGTLYVTYLSYNMAMILKRRQPNEFISVVADFLRDLLNFTTYPVRVLFHWRGYNFQ